MLVLGSRMLSVVVSGNGHASLVMPQRHALARRHGGKALDWQSQGHGDDGQEAKQTLQHGVHFIGLLPVRTLHQRYRT